MEEVKQNAENVCTQGACGHGGSCMDMHKFCYRGCCLIRCILVVLLTAFVFALGYCAGIHEERERSGSSFGERSHHNIMYETYGDDGEFGRGNDGTVQVIYKTIDQNMPQQMVTPTTAK